MQRAMRRLALAMLTTFAWTGTGWPQLDSYQNGARLLMTRAELESLRAQYTQLASAHDAKPETRALARIELELIQSRLERGDFQAGDQISVTVHGQDQLTGTFTVVSTPTGVALRLPQLGDIPLDGVLRSEVEAHLRAGIARYIRDPVVHAESTIRLSVLQGVERPGFYSAGAEDLLTDVLMLAGGPRPQAKLDKIRIERGKEKIWTGEALQQAIAQGRTLDQLSLRAGDRVIIPIQEERRWLTVLQATSIIIPAIFALSRVF